MRALVLQHIAGPSRVFGAFFSAAQLETTFMFVGGDYEGSQGTIRDAVLRYDQEAEKFDQLSVKVIY